MRRTVVAVILTAGTWMGLAQQAHAQVLIMPTGPLSAKLAASPLPEELLSAPPADEGPGIAARTSDLQIDNPGRTMGGGRRSLRQCPPPSSLKPRKE